MNFLELKKMVNDDRFLNAVEDQITAIHYIDMSEEPNHYIVVKFEDTRNVIYVDELRFDDFEDFSAQIDNENIINAVKKIYYTNIDEEEAEFLKYIEEN